MRHTKTLAVIAGVLALLSSAERRTRATSTSTWTNVAHTLYTDKPIPGAVLVSTGAQRPAGSRRAHQRRQPGRHHRSSSPRATSASPGAERCARRRERRQGSRSITRPSAARRPRETYYDVDQLAAPLQARQGWQARIPQRCRARTAAHRRRQGRRIHLRPPRLKQSFFNAHERRPWAAFSFVALAPWTALIIRAYDARRLCRSRCHGCSHGEKSPSSRVCSRPSGIAAATKAAGARRRARLPITRIARRFRRRRSTRW